MVTRTLINKIFPGLKLSDTIISLIAAVSLFSIPWNLKKENIQKKLPPLVNTTLYERNVRCKIAPRVAQNYQTQLKNV